MNEIEKIKLPRLSYKRPQTGLKRALSMRTLKECAILSLAYSEDIGKSTPNRNLVIMANVHKAWQISSSMTRVKQRSTKKK